MIACIFAGLRCLLAQWCTACNSVHTEVCALLQDLSHTLLILWADSPAAIVNKDTAPFFEAFSAHISGPHL